MRVLFEVPGAGIGLGLHLGEGAAEAALGALIEGLPGARGRALASLRAARAQLHAAGIRWHAALPLPGLSPPGLAHALVAVLSAEGDGEPVLVEDSSARAGQGWTHVVAWVPVPSAGAVVAVSAAAPGAGAAPVLRSLVVAIARTVRPGQPALPT